MKLSSSSNVASVVEIGSYFGASAAALSAGLSSGGAGGRIICIDTWNNDAMSEGNQDTLTRFLSNTKEYSSYINPIRGWSTDESVVNQVKQQAGRIDLLFIDGDHSYDGALADWKTYKPFLSEQAIIVMHDISWAEGVQRVVAEEIRPYVTREEHLPNLWWGWMGK
jgi:predicted O-methyltransferase YrrM